MISTTTNAKPIQPLLLTAAYYLSFIILGLSTAVEGPSLPTLAKHTSTSLDQISLMFVVGSLGYLLGSIIGGKAYDSLPGHRFIAATMAVMVAAAVIFPLATALWVLLLNALIMGICKGALDVGCNTLLQWVHKEKVGPFMNGLHFFFGIGAFFSPILLARIFSATQEIYWSFWIIALLIVPLAVWFWFLPEPSAQSNNDQTNHSPIPFVPVFLIVVAFFLYVGAEVGFANWIYTYAVTLNLATTITAAYLTSAFWGSFTVGRLLGVWISTRVSSRTILFVDLTGCLASLALIILGRESAPLLWAGSIGLGFSMASIFPTILMLAGESMRVSGTITGWFLVGSGAGGMLLPWLIGQAFTASGPYAMMTIIFADLILNVLILAAFIYGRRTRRSRQYQKPRPASSTALILPKKGDGDRAKRWEVSKLRFKGGNGRRGGTRRWEEWLSSPASRGRRTRTSETRARLGTGAIYRRGACLDLRNLRLHRTVYKQSGRTLRIYKKGRRE